VKKFISQTGAFVGLFVGVVLLPCLFLASFDQLDKASSDNSNIISLQHKSRFDSLDILWVGNSYCYSGIRPVMLDSLGIASYNLGIATAGPGFYDLVITDYLKHVSKAPTYVFMLLSPMTFSKKADNFESYPIHRYLEAPQSHWQISMDEGSFSQLVPLYKKSLEKGGRNLLAGAHASHSPKLEKKGFVGSDEVFSQQILRKTEHHYLSFQQEKWVDDRLKKLQEVVKKVEARGIKLVFFELPTHLLRDYFSQEYLAAYEAAVRELSAKHRYFRVPPEHFSTVHYRNIDHLNTAGATLATREVMRFIKREKLLD
jgi:hypothetical protein